MKTYIINIATATKKDDVYDNVCTNLYPIIIKTYDDQHLRDHLIKLKDKIKSTLKSKYLYEHAMFYIRTLEGDEFKIPLKNIVEINYEGNH